MRQESAKLKKFIFCGKRVARTVFVLQKHFSYFRDFVGICSHLVCMWKLLDYLLDFACDEKMLGLYQRVCRKYLDVYPGCIRDYIEAYREMWEDEDSYSADFS